MADTLMPKRNDLRMVGPNPVQSFGFQFGPGMAAPIPQGQTNEGWQFTRNAANGAPLEAVVCSDDTLTYETSEYKRWTIFNQRLAKVVGDMLPLASTSLDLAGLTLEYVDRFVFEGAPENADARNLLVGAVGHIHEDAASGNSPWHLHSGWFENVPGGKVLINQNFDIQDGTRPDRTEPLRSIQILTNASFRVPHYDMDLDRFQQLLDELHAHTKLYVRKVLRPEILALIGLKNDA